MPRLLSYLGLTVSVESELALPVRKSVIGLVYTFCSDCSSTTEKLLFVYGSFQGWHQWESSYAWRGLALIETKQNHTKMAKFALAMLSTHTPPPFFFLLILELSILGTSLTCGRGIDSLLFVALSIFCLWIHFGWLWETLCFSLVLPGWNQHLCTLLTRKFVLLGTSSPFYWGLVDMKITICTVSIQFDGQVWLHL